MVANYKLDMGLYNEIKEGTNIISGEEYKNTLIAISKLASDVVKNTLGPYAHTTVLDDGTFTYATKDGWATLNQMRFDDPMHNTLYKLIKDISFSIVNKVGDGTTTAIVAANHFIEELSEFMNTQEFGNIRQAELLHVLTEVKDEIVNALKSPNYLYSIDTDGDFSDIKKIAYVSSNANEELASMIQEIYQKTNNPNIYVTLNGGTKTSYEILTGYRLDASPLNLKVYANTEEGYCKKSMGCDVVVFDHNVSYSMHGNLITALSTYANRSHRDMVIFAPYYDDIITGIISSAINQMINAHQVPNIMMVQVPLSMEIDKKLMKDFLMIADTEVFGAGKVKAFNMMYQKKKSPEDFVEMNIDDSLLNIEGYSFESTDDLIMTSIGHISDITFTKKYCLVNNYDKDKNVYRNTLAEVQADYITAKQKANSSTNVLNKEYMDAYKRYSRLCGNVGTINVGEFSELAKHCLKDAVDDAVLACKSAYENGYVKGLNLTTLTIITDIAADINPTKTIEDAERREIVLDILYRVFSRTSLDVMNNKYQLDGDDKNSKNIKVWSPLGYEHKLSSEEVLDVAISFDRGFNIVTEEFEKADNLSVINSVQTDIEILNAMVGILSLILTSSQFISINRLYDKKVSRSKAMANSREMHKVNTLGIIDAIKESSDGNMGNIINIAGSVLK